MCEFARFVWALVTLPVELFWPQDFDTEIAAQRQRFLDMAEGE